MFDFKSSIRTIPDFPKKDILFKDITTLLKDGAAFKESIDAIHSHFKGLEVDIIVGMESRGFILGAPLAYNFGSGFVPARKQGKLPAETIGRVFDTEYSTDHLEIHVDSITEGQHVLVVDDLLATGGTSQAMIEVIEKIGGKVVGAAFLIELDFLNGRDALSGYNVFSLVKYKKGE